MPDPPGWQTAKQWLMEHGISDKSYYYWQREVRLQAYAEGMKPNVLSAAQENTSVAFAEILFTVEADTLRAEHFEPAAIIHSGGMMALSNTVSDGLLTRLLQEVCHA